jgi:hypothetical protein
MISHLSLSCAGQALNGDLMLFDKALLASRCTKQFDPSDAKFIIPSLLNTSPFEFPSYRKYISLYWRKIFHQLDLIKIISY